MAAETPAAPLEKAVEEAREALADARKIINKWIIGYKGPPKSELAGHIIIMADALTALLAALDADRGGDSGLSSLSEQWSRCERNRGEAEEALGEIKARAIADSADCVSENFIVQNVTDAIDRYFARREGKEVPRG